MTKIMIVEDDNSLREIYSIRLTAEGYDVVSAGDGEEALAIAVRERPALILSDVMMPKISGFDMLDIIRQTPETANIKVIMMTALSSNEQRARGEDLGADKYLVKSQVGIEDVITAIHEVLADRNTPTVETPASAANAFSAPAAPAAPATTTSEIHNNPSTPASTPQAAPTPLSQSVEPSQPGIQNAPIPPIG